MSTPTKPYEILRKLPEGWFVESAVYSSTRPGHLCVRLFPVSPSMSAGPWVDLDGMPVNDWACSGIYRLDSEALTAEQLGTSWRLRDARIRLRSGNATEPIGLQFTPIPQPKVRRGIPVVWDDDRGWMKVLKSGRVAV